MDSFISPDVRRQLLRQSLLREEIYRAMLEFEHEQAIRGRLPQPGNLIFRRVKPVLIMMGSILLGTLASAMGIGITFYVLNKIIHI